MTSTGEGCHRNLAGVYLRVVGRSRFGWLRGQGPSAALALALAGCSLDDLPPCGAVEIAGQTRGLSEPSPTVMAISDGSERLTILRACSIDATCEADLIEQVVTVTAPPEQLLLTGSGRWLTYVAGHELQRVDLDAEAPIPSSVAIEFDRMELVGSLRGGDWILYRTWAEGTISPDPEVVPPTHTSELFARYVGDDASFPFSVEHASIRVDAGQFRVAAVGHRNIVVRKSLGNGYEELYLVRIAPSFRSDEHGSAQIGETLLLAKGRTFERVIVTSGQSPRELGDPDAFPKLPNDMLVIATSGAGQTARTVVYDIRDLGLLANFEGSVATSLLPLHDVPGLSAVAPDHSHLAYVTKRGALALRNLDNQTSCELRSAQGQGHVLAGFGRDGTLYFQSREDDLLDDLEPRIREYDRVYAYDSATQAYAVLSESPNRRPLRAVPEGHPEGVPWALVASSGVFATLPEIGLESVGFDDASFLSRGDESLWVLGAETVESGTNDPVLELALRRVHVTSPDEDRHQLEADGPSVVQPGVGVRDYFRLAYDSSNRVCVSLAQSSHATPWATKCSAGNDHPTRYLSEALPFTEQR
jgi:hypothetical protein